MSAEAEWDAPTPVVPEGFTAGIHFGVTDEQYDAIPALNASGIKWLRVSLPDYWMRSIFNPKRDEIVSEDESFAKMLGTAYHKRIPFGRAYFEQNYAPELSKSDFPDVLITAEDLKAVLSAKGLKTSGKKQELIDRLLEADPTAKVWDAILDGYEKKNEGKIFLPWRNIERIEIAAKMIEADPELCKAFTGGEPEVTVCWICEKTGVPLKCKIDYLKPKALVELKSFSNPYGKPLDRAIGTAIASMRYHIALALYMEGAAQIAGLIKQERVFGACDPDLLQALALGHEKTYFMVWQATGIAPVARGRVFPTSSYFFQAGQQEVDQAKHLWRAAYEKFGPNELWADSGPITAIDDAVIPLYGLE